MAIHPLLLIQARHLSNSGEMNVHLSTGNLPLGGLPRNSVVRITDRPDIALVADCRGIAQTQPTIYYGLLEQQIKC